MKVENHMTQLDIKDLEDFTCATWRSGGIFWNIIHDMIARHLDAQYRSQGFSLSCLSQFQREKPCEWCCSMPVRRIGLKDYFPKNTTCPSCSTCKSSKSLLLPGFSWTTINITILRQQVTNGCQKIKKIFFRMVNDIALWTVLKQNGISSDEQKLNQRKLWRSRRYIAFI